MKGVDETGGELRVEEQETISICSMTPLKAVDRIITLSVVS